MVHVKSLKCLYPAATSRDPIYSSNVKHITKNPGEGLLALSTLWPVAKSACARVVRDERNASQNRNFLWVWGYSQALRHSHGKSPLGMILAMTSGDAVDSRKWNGSSDVSGLKSGRGCEGG